MFPEKVRSSILRAAIFLKGQLGGFAGKSGHVIADIINSIPPSVSSPPLTGHVSVVVQSLHHGSSTSVLH